jgi:hypothetical protein
MAFGLSLTNLFSATYIFYPVILENDNCLYYVQHRGKTMFFFRTFSGWDLEKCDANGAIPAGPSVQKSHFPSKAAGRRSLRGGSGAAAPNSRVAWL